MENSHQLSLGGILRTAFGRLLGSIHVGTRSDAKPLERIVESSRGTNRFPLAGQVESLGDTDNRYNLNISIKKRAAEKGQYYINCADLIRFIDTIYPGYVRGADGNYIQVSLHSDKPSDQKPIIFPTYRELTRYVEDADLARIINEPNVSIKYSGSAKDVPQTVSIKRKSLSFSTTDTTDYRVVVEASKAYNLGMIDLCVSLVFNGRATLSRPDMYRQ